MFQPDQFKKSFNEAFSKYFDSNFSIVVTSTIPLLSPKETNLGLGIRYDF